MKYTLIKEHWTTLTTHQIATLALCMLLGLRFAFCFKSKKYLITVILSTNIEMTIVHLDGGFISWYTYAKILFYIHSQPLNYLFIYHIWHVIAWHHICTQSLINCSCHHHVLVYVNLIAKLANHEIMIATCVEFTQNTYFVETLRNGVMWV